MIWSKQLQIFNFELILSSLVIGAMTPATQSWIFINAAQIETVLFQIFHALRIPHEHSQEQRHAIEVQHSHVNGRKQTKTLQGFQVGAEHAREKS